MANPDPDLREALPEALARLLGSALPRNPNLPPETAQAVVGVLPRDLRMLLRLVMRMKHDTPADCCVVCRHKDRQHGGDMGCFDCESHGRVCLGYIGIEALPFDARIYPSDPTPDDEIG